MCYDSTTQDIQGIAAKALKYESLIHIYYNMN
jgi:hypothetical protein